MDSDVDPHCTLLAAGISGQAAGLAGGVCEPVGKEVRQSAPSLARSACCNAVPRGVNGRAAARLLWHLPVRCGRCPAIHHNAGDYTHSRGRPGRSFRAMSRARMRLICIMACATAPGSGSGRHPWRRRPAAQTQQTARRCRPAAYA
jgi:hypothetical protein